MKCLFSILLLGSFFFLLPTKHEVPPEESIAGQYGALKSQPRDQASKAIGSATGDVDDNRMPSVRVVSSDSDHSSCQKNCFRDCAFPAAFHCLGVIFYCSKKCHCSQRS